MSTINSSVLITGGGGFIGANFVRKFLELGYQVTVAERQGGNLWRLQDIQDKVSIQFTDLTDRTSLETFIATIKPDIVVHLAAYGAYQRFQQDVGLTIDTNLKGTINLMDACMKTGVKAFINTGSSSEYGIKEAPMRETDLLEADNLYGMTKAAATLYGQMLAKKHGFPVITIRPFAAYGPFEEPGRLVPDIIAACLQQKELKLSSPASVRDFIYTDDLFDGYLAAIEHIQKVTGEVFNLGGGKQYTIGQVVDAVKQLTGSAVNPIYGSMEKAQTEPATWQADISKAKQLLGWQPKHTLESGLQKNIEWLKSNLSLYQRD